MRRPGVVAAVGLALVVFAAGCGDDSSGGSPFAPGPGDDTDVDLDDLDLDDLDLDDAVQNAEDMIDQFGGEGHATVQFNGDTIEADAEVCLTFDDDFDFEGPGTSPDGTPVWVSINHTIDTRAELAEYIDEAIIDQLYGTADPVISSSFGLEYGRAEMFASGTDDLPDVNAESTVDTSEISIDSSGSSASGSGRAIDWNGILGDFSETFEFSFEVSCG